MSQLSIFFSLKTNKNLTYKKYIYKRTIYYIWINQSVHDKINKNKEGTMRISKLIYVVFFSWVLGIFSIASAQELCTECLSKVPKDMRD